MKLRHPKPASYNKVVSTLQKTSQTALGSPLKNKTFNKPLSNLADHNQNTAQKVTVFRKHFVHNKSITEMMDVGSKQTKFRFKAGIQYILDDFNEIQHIGPFLINVNSSSGYLKTQWKQLYNPQKKCSCDKSACLKNYCICYLAGHACSTSCNCHNCRNNNSYIKQGQASNPIKSSPSIKQVQYNNRQANQQIRCQCNKTNNCLKSYCGCHRLGINCSDACKCKNCQN